MIYDWRAEFGRYKKMAPEAWRLVEEFLKKTTPEMPTGRYELAGTDVYAMVQSYNTHPADPMKLEIHRDYIDIQLLLSGRETILFEPVEGRPVTAAYDPARDIAFYGLDASSALPVKLEPGNFAVFFPGEGHLPGVGDPAEGVVKVVVKIRA